MCNHAWQRVYKREHNHSLTVVGWAVKLKSHVFTIDISSTTSTSFAESSTTTSSSVSSTNSTTTSFTTTRSTSTNPYGNEAKRSEAIRLHRWAICFANSEIIGDLETTFDGSITILFRKVENTILIDLRNDRFSDLFILHSEYTKFKNILKSKVFNLIHWIILIYQLNIKIKNIETKSYTKKEEEKPSERGLEPRPFASKSRVVPVRHQNT